MPSRVPKRRWQSSTRDCGADEVAVAIILRAARAVKICNNRILGVSMLAAAKLLMASLKLASISKRYSPFTRSYFKLAQKVKCPDAKKAAAEHTLQPLFVEQASVRGIFRYHLGPVRTGGAKDQTALMKDVANN
jgi:hypothetical protein